MRGRFITLEGGEGAGKTTAIETVAEWLEGQGCDFVVTREPGGTPPAERIRELLLDHGTGELGPLTELLLMFAARNENLERVIRPALESGRDVICDRFTDASIAYQGGGRRLGREPIESLAGMVHGDLEPDLTLLLDVPVEIGLARISGRGTGPDRIESARAGFLDRVRDAYLEQARRQPGRIAVIDASAGIDEVTRLVRETLEARLG